MAYLAISAVSLLESLHAILSLSFTVLGLRTTTNLHGGYSYPPECQQILDELPKSLNGALAKFDIDPELTKLACCVTCCATYEPVIGKDGKAYYPEFCTHKETPTSEVCGEQLVVDLGFKEATCKTCKAKHLPSWNDVGELAYPSQCTQEVKGKPCNGKIKAPQDQDWNTPRREFIFQRFLAHLARWTALPHVEDAVERFSKLALSGENDVWRSSLQAEYARNFRGPDGRRFLEPSGTDIHFVFSLFVDWFNPNLNKAAGKSSTIGGLYMACLNLPEHLRFKDENMYLVGLIPGPSEPHKHEINHFLRHIVDDLTALWNGVFLTRTFKHPHGRLVRCALIPLVADLPAIRKTAGFVGHKATLFCSFCQLTKESMGLFNRAAWPRRTAEVHRFIAERWRDAQSESDREAITSAHGIRWSELLRLQYWDPIRFSVVDSMHNLFLGLIRHHCINLWKMDIESGEKENTLKPHTAVQQLTFLMNAKRLIDSGGATLKSQLEKFRKGYITGIASVNGLRPQGGKDTKEAYIDAILCWVH